MMLAAALLVAPPVAAQTDEELAKRYSKLGEVLYNRSEYEGALKQFKRSYDYSERPALLYNIARCHESLGQHEKAIDVYTKYLATKPRQRGIIEQRIKNLRRLVQKKREKQRAGEASEGDGPAAAAAVDAAASGAAPTNAAAGGEETPEGVATAGPGATDSASPPGPRTAMNGRTTAPDQPGRAIEPPGPVAKSVADTDEPTRPLRLTGWILAGTGGALLAAGITTGVMARSRASDVEAAGDEGKEWSEVSGTYDEGETLEKVSIATLVTGGLAAAAGAVLVVLDWRAAREERTERRAWVVPGVTAGGATLSAGVRF
jgi:hypothetical protein